MTYLMTKSEYSNLPLRETLREQEKVRNLANQVKLEINAKTSTKDLKLASHSSKLSIQAIGKTRPAAFLFFKSSKFPNETNNLIAQFLGCEDIPFLARLSNMNTFFAKKTNTNSASVKNVNLETPDIYTPEFWL